MVVADEHVALGFVTTPARPRTGITFVDDLDTHGDSVAVIDADGSAISYRALDAMVEDRAKTLGRGPRLVAVEMTNDLDSVAWYLAALRGGHAVIVTDTGPPAMRVVEGFDPDVVIHGNGALTQHRPETIHDLHEDLALLLSTSGSTGSAKLVRLSRKNLDSNARSIAAALGIRATDRAITSLPLHYCYGLSVLHSHLTAGATVVLTDTSVADTCFWTAVDQHGVTTMAGVPHTFDLLDRIGFDGRRHPSIRVITQAGGRLAPDKVRRWATAGTEQGFDLRVMYGQTEATARIAVSDVDDALTHPHAVGRVVPGGWARVEPVADAGDDGEGDGEDVGELVFSGPNVMMGYAEAPTDLVRGAELSELRTGDLARISADGLIEIVGRRADFVKLFGLRIDLREVEHTARDLGMSVSAVVGDDDGIVIACVDHEGLEPARVALARKLGLPAATIAVAVPDELPLLGNGKLDRRGLLASIRHTRIAPQSSVDDSVAGPPPASVGDVFASVLGIDPPPPTESFVSLGGDSLSYVEASILLEAHLGRLPDGWHHTPIGDLAQVDTGARNRRHRQLETNVVLRAVAIVFILANHTGAFLVGGGAHVLLAAAGFNLSRFQLRNGAPWMSILRLAIPAISWVGLVAAFRPDFDLAHTLMLHGWIGGPGRWAYWFVEVLLQILVVVAIAFSVPAVRRLDSRHPMGLPAILLVPALLVRFDVIDLGTHHRMFFRPHEVAWIFLLGWLAERTVDIRHRIGVSALVALSVPGFFGDTTRELVLAGGLLALLWVRRIAVPRQLAPAIGALAAASLWIYLTHFQVHPLLSDDHPWLAIAASIVVGTAAWRTIDPRLQRLTRRLQAGLRHDAEQGDQRRDTVGA